MVEKPDCFDVPDELTEVDLARNHILAGIETRVAVVDVNLASAGGRILASDVTAGADVPPSDNAAMDGFALNGNDIPKEGASRELQVRGLALAGKPWRGTLEAGDCVRIMTGAFMPEGCDSVIPQEHVPGDHEAATIIIDSENRSGQNVRPRGEDISAGTCVLESGSYIGAPELGVLASIGVNELRVFDKLKVAVFSTGDELIESGEELGDGNIYDANRPMLRALCDSSGAELTDLGILADDYETVRNALSTAAAQHDVIITSGGVSTGVADYVTRALGELGQLGVWRIALRPGRPFAHGRIGNCEFFGLPGNPVAVLVTFEQLVRPALRRLMGDRAPSQATGFALPCVDKLRKRAGRTELYRAVMFVDDDGQLKVRSTGKQSSGLLRSMSVANCFVLLEHDAEESEAGTLVRVIPFRDRGAPQY